MFLQLVSALASCLAKGLVAITHMSNFVLNTDFSIRFLQKKTLTRATGGGSQPNPTRPHDAFEKLISLERVDRFTSGLLLFDVTIQ